MILWMSHGHGCAHELGPGSVALLISTVPMFAALLFVSFWRTAHHKLGWPFFVAAFAILFGTPLALGCW